MNTETITLKLRLYASEKYSLAFQKLTQRYSEACNDISKKYFQLNESLTKTKLNKKYYYHLRGKYGLKAQEAESVIKTVIARYKAVDTQRKIFKDYKFKDSNTDKWYSYPENAHWIWNPIHFNRPQADLVVNRDWRFSRDTNHVVISILSGCIHVKSYLPRYFRKYLAVPHKLGVAKLLHYNNGHWWLHISCTIQAPDAEPEHVVGIDRGWRFLATTYGLKSKHSKFWNGLQARHKRRHYINKRAELQSKCSKSAKKKLRRMSGRENRWMTDVNHRVSKALVLFTPRHTAYVLENLRHIRWTLEQVPKSQRGVQVSWAFYQLGIDITYKALMHSSIVVHVPAQYTSQRCPFDHTISPFRRNHKLHIYKCEHCGKSENDDRIGAMNIAQVGEKKLQGDSHPAIELTEYDQALANLYHGLKKLKTINAY